MKIKNLLLILSILALSLPMDAYSNADLSNVMIPVKNTVTPMGMLYFFGIICLISLVGTILFMIGDSMISTYKNGKQCKECNHCTDKN